MFIELNTALFLICAGYENNLFMLCDNEKTMVWSSCFKLNVINDSHKHNTSCIYFDTEKAYAGPWKPMYTEIRCRRRAQTLSHRLSSWL